MGMASIVISRNWTGAPNSFNVSKSAFCLWLHTDSSVVFQAGELEKTLAVSCDENSSTVKRKATVTVYDPTRTVQDLVINVSSI
jgi:hypothetical protein